jgi:hypothetical protein
MGEPPPVCHDCEEPLGGTYWSSVPSKAFDEDEWDELDEDVQEEIYENNTEEVMNYQPPDNIRVRRIYVVHTTPNGGTILSEVLHPGVAINDAIDESQQKWDLRVKTLKKRGLAAFTPSGRKVYVTEFSKDDDEWYAVHQVGVRVQIS